MTTTIQTDAIGLTAFIMVGAAYLIFALALLLRVRARTARATKRAPVAMFGVVLQGVAFTLVWAAHRAHWWPFRDSMSAEVALAIAAVALAWTGGWLCFWSVQILGKQWALQARVIEGHELITEGPYHIVRNPIYLGMFGVVLATGLVQSTWWALLAAIVVYVLGTQLRIRAEEMLLRKTFGAQFADYASRVPAFLPRIFPR
jgi:protein-S-isoprenylcysteine O-methyltransferase Ste14